MDTLLLLHDPRRYGHMYFRLLRDFDEKSLMEKHVTRDDKLDEMDRTTQLECRKINKKYDG